MAIGKRVALILTLITSMVFSPAMTMAQSGSSTSDWSSLRSIPVDSKLSVKLKTGKTIDGKLRSVSDSSLTPIMSARRLSERELTPGLTGRSQDLRE